MKRFFIVMVCFCIVILLTGGSSSTRASSLNAFSENLGKAPSSRSSQENINTIVAKNVGQTAMEEEKESGEEIEPLERAADPLEGYNKFIFTFNDKVYSHFLKPVAKGYGAIVPEKARVSIDKFFLNLYSPIRFINAGLQGDKKGALHEVSRFAINSTLGVAGFFDPAKSVFHLDMQKDVRENRKAQRTRHRNTVADEGAFQPAFEIAPYRGVLGPPQGRAVREPRGA